MKKIKSLYKRSYNKTRLVYDEIVDGMEWVINGEGIATEKLDGTACMIQDNKLYKRYDRKVKNCKHSNKELIFTTKNVSENWIPCEDKPDLITGHWPGWIPIGNGSEDKYHREAFKLLQLNKIVEDGTYELVGTKIQGNPYNMNYHFLFKHGSIIMKDFSYIKPPYSFENIKEYLLYHNIEGIVWHHKDGRMAKIKRRDFGFDWPIRGCKNNG